MIPLLAIAMLGFAGMLGIMGWQQLRRGFRLAAGFSLVTAVVLAVLGGWILVDRVLG